MRLRDELRVVIDTSERTWVLDDSTEVLCTEVELIPLPEDDFDTLREAACEDDITRGGEDILIDKELTCPELGLSLRAFVEEQEGRFSTSRSLIKEGAVT